MNRDTEITETCKIDAYGEKGMKATPWRRTFKNLAALNAWADKTDSCKVIGIRNADAD